MLAQRLRRWPNIKTSLFQHVGLLGVYYVCSPDRRNTYVCIRKCCVSRGYYVCMFISFSVCIYYYTLWRAAANGRVCFTLPTSTVHKNVNTADHFEYQNMPVV